MAKQGKAFKKFRKNKSLVKKVIHKKKIVQAKRREEEYKQQKILQSKDEVEEQTPEQLQQQPKKKSADGTGFDTDDKELRSFFSSGFMEQLEKRIRNDGEPASKKRKVEEDGEEHSEEEADDDDEAASDDSDAEEEGEGEDEDYVSQVKQLAKNDPEFYKFLQQEDANLLEFAESAAEAGESDAEVDDEAPADNDAEIAEGDEEDAQAKALVAKKRVLTSATIKSWAKNVKTQHSATAMKHILLAFRCAVHMNDSADNASKGTELEESESGAGKKNVKRQRKIKKQVETDKTQNIPFTINSPEVRMDVIVYSSDAMLAFLDKEFKRTSSDTALPDKDSMLWAKHSLAIRMFLRSLLHLLTHTVEKDSLSFILKTVEAFVPYFGNFQVLSRKLLKQLLGLLGNREETVRFRAFMAIRRLAISLPYPFLDLCLKGVYLTMVQNSKFYNAHSLPLLDFLINGIIELFGLDFSSAYQHAFVYIRQLALTLRTALDRTTKDSHQVLYNWKYINCLRCWTRVLSAYPMENELRDLIYPLVQVIMGVINFSKSSTYYPLRFTCVSMLTDLARASGMFIPAAPYLFPVLDSSEVKHKPKHSLKTPLDFLFSLRAAEKSTKSREFQTKIVEETLFLMLKHLEPYSRTIAFPELAFPALVTLKKFLHKKYAPHMGKKVATLIEKIEKNSDLIYKHRSNVDFTPSDVEKAKAFAENLLADSANVSKKKKQPQGKKLDLLSATPLEEYWQQEKARHDTEIQQRVEALLDRAQERKEKQEADEENDEGEQDVYGGVEELDEVMEKRERRAMGEEVDDDEEDDVLVSDDEEADGSSVIDDEAEEADSDDEDEGDDDEEEVESKRPPKSQQKQRGGNNKHQQKKGFQKKAPHHQNKHQQRKQSPKKPAAGNSNNNNNKKRKRN